ncbi:MAG: fibronectin type III domain-containing protein, partial [Pseudonocardia sp.]
MGDEAIGSGHQLTGAGIDRIPGLQAVVGSGVRSFSAGNIILGGGGSDIIEGRGGDDVIDGDKWLNVRLSVRTDPSNPATETRTANSMSELQGDVFAGALDPGNIVIVREILSGGSGADVDTAMFSDARSAYQCSVNGGALGTCPTTLSGGTTRIVHVGGTGLDGTDTLTGVERLLFSDSAAPAAPTILAAQGGFQSATVNFEPAVGSVVNSFTVRATDQASGAILTRTADGDATSLVFTGLTNGRSYRFDVQAVNAFGPSPFSAQSNVVTPNATVPGVPGVPTATASNGQATVSWSAPGNNGGSAINGYLVQPVNGAGNPVGAPRPANGTSLVVNGLDNGTTYRFSVQARNTVGTGPASGLSNAVTPLGAPGAPEIGNATAGVGSATVRWSAPTEDGGTPRTGYQVEVQTTAGNVVTTLNAPANATSLVVAGLTNGTSYRFRVRATNNVGGSAFSGLSNAVTPSTVPGSPTITGVTAGDGRATVRWNAPANNGGSPITGYLVRVLTATGLVVENVPVAAGARTATVL